MSEDRLTTRERLRKKVPNLLLTRTMSIDPTGAEQSLQLSIREAIDWACDQFETAWKGGEQPTIEVARQGIPAAGMAALFAELLPGYGPPGC